MKTEIKFVERNLSNSTFCFCKYLYIGDLEVEEEVVIKRGTTTEIQDPILPHLTEDLTLEAQEPLGCEVFNMIPK